MAEENQITFVQPPAIYKLFQNGCSAKPPVPPDGEVTVFGQKMDMSDDYGQSDKPCASLLQSLAAKNKEALLLFLQLLNTLANNPNGYSKQVNEINKIMQEMLQGVNSLRAFQARATLEYALKYELEDKKKRLEELQQQIDAALEQMAALPPIL